MRKRVTTGGIESFQVLFRQGSRQRSKTFATKKAAQNFANMIEALGLKRALAELEAAAGGTILNDLAAGYWEYLPSRVRSERTITDYKRDYKNWIAEPLGWQLASQIDEEAVQDWVDSMRGKLSPKSIGDRHAILHGIFKWASAPTRRIVPTGHNPCVGTELPKRHKKAPHGLRPAEWQALIAALDVINPDAADLADFLLASGWRWSEATALTTFDVEDDGVIVHVTMSRVARRQSDGSVEVVEDAKSEAGLRRIKLDTEASALVRRRVGHAKPGGCVFTTTEGSMWNYSHYRGRFWVKAVAAANLTRKPTIHWLRHTSVGYLALSGKVSMAEIQRRIGHESIQTTFDVYGGMIEDVSSEALDAFSAMRGLRLPVIAEVESKGIEG